MIQRIQMLSRGQRVVIFFMMFAGGLAIIGTITVLLILGAVNSTPRDLSRPISSEALALPLGTDGSPQQTQISVSEYAQFEDEEAHPSAIALGPDGLVYVGSYATGTVWRLEATAEGDSAAIVELPGTREAIGSVTGITVAPDGSVYVVDRLDPNPRAAGGTIWRISDGELTDLVDFVSATRFIAPGHATLDAQGRLYVSDRGRREVWRYDLEAESAELFWTVPEDISRSGNIIPTGLAYDPSTDTLLISDSDVGLIFRVRLDDASSEIIYRHSGSSESPGFDGLDVDAAGNIYVALLGSRAVALLAGDELVGLAENFRQVSDIAVHGSRIYATNQDARSLVVPGIEPQLPFSIDLITLNPAQ